MSPNLTVNKSTFFIIAISLNFLITAFIIILEPTIATTYRNTVKENSIVRSISKSGTIGI